MRAFKIFNDGQFNSAMLNNLNMKQNKEAIITGTFGSFNMLTVNVGNITNVEFTNMASILATGSLSLVNTRVQNLTFDTQTGTKLSVPTGIFVNVDIANRLTSTNSTGPMKIGDYNISTSGVIRKYTFTDPGANDNIMYVGNGTKNIASGLAQSSIVSSSEDAEIVVDTKDSNDASIYFSVNGAQKAAFQNVLSSSITNRFRVYDVVHNTEMLTITPGAPQFYISMNLSLSHEVVSRNMMGFQATSLTLANGVNSDVSLVGKSTYMTITGPSAGFSITGFDITYLTGGTVNIVDGAIIKLSNLTGQNLTITHQATSGANNQITTMTGANVVSTGNCFCEFIYHLTTNKWILCFMNA